MSQLFPNRICSPQAVRDFAELFEGGFEVIGDFLHEPVGLGKIAGFFAALLASRSIAGAISIMSPESRTPRLGL
jgi:hypothetical protein